MKIRIKADLTLTMNDPKEMMDDIGATSPAEIPEKLTAYFKAQAEEGIGDKVSFDSLNVSVEA